MLTATRFANSFGLHWRAGMHWQAVGPHDSREFDPSVYVAFVHQTANQMMPTQGTLS